LHPSKKVSSLLHDNFVSVGSVVGSVFGSVVGSVVGSVIGSVVGSVVGSVIGGDVGDGEEEDSGLHAHEMFTNGSLHCDC
jgi:outer membrane lipoprotein SlyB